MRHSRHNRIYYDKPDDGAAGAPVVSPVVAASTAPVLASTDKPIEPVTPPPVEPPKKDWKDDRIGKLTHDLNEERRLRAAEAAARAPVQKPGETEADFAKRVDEAANAKAPQIAQQIAAQADWDRQCNQVAELGRKDFPDFDVRLKAITTTVNDKDPVEVSAYNGVIEAAIETGQAHKIIYALGSDPGEYQRLMKLSPVKRAIELGKMAITLVNDPEPSKLPKPIVPVDSRGEHHEGIAPDDPKRGGKLSTKEWMRLREAQARERNIQ